VVPPERSRERGREHHQPDQRESTPHLQGAEAERAGQLAIEDPCGQPAPEDDAREHHRQGDRVGEDGVANEECEIARPQHLTAEGYEAGQEEEECHDEGSARRGLPASRGRGRCELCHGPTQGPHAHAGDQAQRPPQPDRRLHADLGQQDQSGARAPEHRPEGVQAVEKADGTRHLGVLPHVLAAEEGQRPPHQEGGGKYDQRHQCEARAEEQDAPLVEGPVDVPVEGVGEIEGVGARHRQQPQADLEQCVQAEGMGASLGEAPEEVASPGQPQEEGREHRAHGEGAGSEDQ
jgi:hypothetical protein